MPLAVTISEWGPQNPQSIQTQSMESATGLDAPEVGVLEAWLLWVITGGDGEVSSLGWSTHWRRCLRVSQRPFSHL